jgi:hypothetical protein
MKKLLLVLMLGGLLLGLSTMAIASPAGIPKAVGDNSELFGVGAGRVLPPLCDNFAFVWNLQVVGSGMLAGTVETVNCGVWDVTGTFDAVNVQLNAVNPVSVSGCADWFTYTGTHTGRQGKTASGTWTNSAGGSGDWSMALCSASTSSASGIDGPTAIPNVVGDNSQLFGVDAGRVLPPLCDVYDYVWHLQIVSPGSLAGTVDVISCGVWDVTGTFDSVNIQLHAVNPDPENGCTEWFTYTGTHTAKQGKTASGTWTNSAGATGEWSMALCF